MASRQSPKHQKSTDRRKARRFNRKQQRKLLIGVTALVVTVVFVAVIVSMSRSGSESSAAQVNAVDVDDGGLNFAVEQLDGDVFNLADYRGQPVAVFAMAGWCSSCGPEAEAWAEIYPSYQERGVELLVLSVDSTDSLDQLTNFQEWTGSQNLPHWAIDRTGEVARLLDVKSLDQTVIIDSSGQIAYVDYQVSTADQLRDALDDVLGT